MTGEPAMRYDVVVVGAGAAGLSAALAAIEERPGARVLMLERATRELRGGNTRYSGAYLRLEDPRTPVSTLVDYGMSASAGRARRDYYESLAERVPEAFEWVQSRGVELVQLPTIFVTLSAPRYQPLGGGAGIVGPLFEALEDTAVEVRYETAARRLVLDDVGAIAAIEVVGPDGVRTRVRTDSVILACGGFQGDAELMTRYIGANAYRLPPISIGGGNNRGDGLRMALEVGAATDGQFDQFHAEPKDPRSSVAEAVVMTFPYGVLVNADGRRFTDEAFGTVDLIYERVARRIFDEPGSMAWAVFDQGMYDVPDWRNAIQTDVEPVTADSIGELATAIGVPVEALERTIADFNAACASDDAGFGWDVEDGLAAAPDGQPRKSNWARRIERGPFLAYPQICANVFTFGGIRTDLDARVVDSDGRVIPGLYAAGETTGLYFENYAGSTSVMRSIVFGRVAGRHAVRG